jgi:excisionase family DNA binding protein
MLEKRSSSVTPMHDEPPGPVRVPHGSNAMRPTRPRSTQPNPSEPTTKLTQRLVTLSEAARYLGLSSWTVRELIWRGVLHRVRLSRKILLDQRDLDAAIEASKDAVDGDRRSAVGLRAPMSLPRKARKGGQR